MKVLFAIGNEQTSKRVAEKYYEKYGEELEYKNVFYFKALLDEVKSNKTYDRIVISEELEQFHVKNLESLDKFIFNNIDNITDEIEESEVIFICSDRRTKENDRFVERLFNIGVYNTLIGDERRVEPLCDYIRKPMNKKEAKRHLNITSIVSDDSLSAGGDTVEEVQIMNILKYYDNIKGKTEEYVPAFDRIAEQYSMNQLKVIIYYLPNDVKEEIVSSDKYMYLAENVLENTRNTNDRKKKTLNKPAKKGLFSILKENKSKENEKQPDVIVENHNSEYKEQLERQKAKERELKEKQEALERRQAMLDAKVEQERKEQELLKKKAEQEALERQQQVDLESKVSTSIPNSDIQIDVMPSMKTIEQQSGEEQEVLRKKAEEEALQREQEMLKKKAEEEALLREQEMLKKKAEEEALQREREMLKKKAEEEALQREQEMLKKKAEEEALLREQEMLKKKAEEEEFVRKQQEMQKIKDEQKAFAKQQEMLSAKAKREAEKKMEQEKLEEEKRRLEQEKLALEEERRRLQEQSEKLNKRNDVDESYSNVKMGYKKIVAFVGANKSGTTFLVNAVSHNLADNRITTGVLDMSRDKSLYYIYNQNDKDLRQIAIECMQKLSEGVDSNIPVKRNLKVYTTIPGPLADSRRAYRNKSIIENVKDFNDVVIIDADFSTPYEYFEKADEIYIVQDLDIMKMQETTLFLRELKNRGISMGKIRIVVNKYVKSILSPKKVIEGLSYYNDPQMSFVDELLSNKVPYFVIPFNVENYSKYIDGVYKNSLDYKKYTADFLEAIDSISKNVYVKVSNKKKGFFR